MKEYMLYNPNSDAIAVGVKLQFFDKIDPSQSLVKLEGYEIRLRSSEDFDAWAVQGDDTDPWVVVEKKHLKCIEVIGEL